MITGLIILNSADVGGRDLWWIDDPQATAGYNVYRAFDAPTNWQKLNDTPVPGHSYRDQTLLEVVNHTVQAGDWITKGELGMFGIQLPEIPYSNVVDGRPVVATNPSDIQITIGSKTYLPAMVNGVDRAVWLRVDRTLPEGGAVSAFPIKDPSTIGTDTVTVTYLRLRNFVDIYTTMVRTFYTVVPVGPNGELHTPGALGTETVNTMEIERMDYIKAEMVRRNAFIFGHRGEPAWLLIRRTKGTLCGCKEAGNEEGRHGCPSCYETGIVGGYYGPIDIPYIDPDQGVSREIKEGSVTVTRTSRSYLGPTPIVQDGDLIIRKNGERLVISNVHYVSPQATLCQQEFDTTLLNKGDTRYLIPLKPSTWIYNPVTEDADPAKEPVFTAVNDPENGKVWENPDVQPGRTVTFGKIQT